VATTPSQLTFLAGAKPAPHCLSPYWLGAE
jgi:hypothetical protein